MAILRRRLLIQGTLAELSGGDRRYRLDLRAPAAELAPKVARVAGVTEVKTEDSFLRFDVIGEVDDVLPEVVKCVVTAGGQVLGLKRDGLDLRSLYRSFVDSADEPEGGDNHV